MSNKYSYDELRRIVEDKIKELRKELEFYEALLTALERGSKGFEKVESRRLKEEVVTLRDSEGNVVATITATQSKIKVVPLIKIDAEHKLVKSYLTRFLDEKKNSNVGRVTEYDIKSANGVISELIIEGNFNEYFLVELEAALQYIINSIVKK